MAGDSAGDAAPVYPVSGSRSAQSTPPGLSSPMRWRGERVKAGNPKLRPDEWKSGDNLWLMDMVAPPEAQEELLKKLREQVFKGRKIKTLQPAPDGSGMAVVEW